VIIYTERTFSAIQCDFSRFRCLYLLFLDGEWGTAAEEERVRSFGGIFWVWTKRAKEKKEKDFVDKRN